MAYSVRANKVTTVEFDVQDLRSFLSEKAQEVLGNSENGYERKIEMEPMFVVQHGEATLAGIRMIVTDTYLAEHG
jgi:hypothetical protein